MRTPLTRERGGRKFTRVPLKESSSDDPQRLRAGLLFVLEQAESDGHTFLPLDEFWQAARSPGGLGHPPGSLCLRDFFGSPQFFASGGTSELTCGNVTP